MGFRDNGRGGVKEDAGEGWNRSEGRVTQAEGGSRVGALDFEVPVLRESQAVRRHEVDGVWRHVRVVEHTDEASRTL